MATPPDLAKVFAQDVLPNEELISDREKFLEELILDVKEKGGTVKDVADEKGRPEGFLLAEEMPFDTEVLGKQCMHLLLCLTRKRGEMMRKKRCIQEFVEKHSSDLIYTRCDVHDRALCKALIELGFLLVTTEIQFAWKREDRASLQQVPRVEGVSIRRGTERDISALKPFAWLFWSNRFRQDSALSRDRARTIYEKWIENAVLGNVGSEDEVWIAEAGKAIVGFATTCVSTRLSKALGKRVGTPGLIAVKEEYRGRGINPLLMATSLLSLLDRAELALAPSHITNLPMIRSELKTGARIVGAEYIFHGHFEKK